MSAKSASISNKSSSHNPLSLEEVVKKAYQQHSTLREIDDLDVIETVILGALVASMPLSEVLKAWDIFRTQFVDWNEVRISSASEVAAVFPKAKDPLQLAMQLKDMLATIFERRHQLSLEFIRENSISETREFFKRSPALPDLAKQLVLAYIKNQQLIPLESWAQGGLVRAGLVASAHTSVQRQRQLHDQLGDLSVLHTVLALHEEARLHPDPAIEEAARRKAVKEKEAAQKAAEAAKQAARKTAELRRAAEKKEAAKIAAEKKAAEKIAAEKKAAEKKAEAKKVAAKKAAEKKAEAKKAAVKKAAAKKAAAKKAAVKKAAEKKAAAKKAAAKKVAAKKAAEKKAAAKKAAAKKSAAKKSGKKATKKTAKKSAAKKSGKKATKKTAKKSAAKKSGRKTTKKTAKKSVKKGTKKSAKKVKKRR